jgi:hypothetical protein
MINAAATAMPILANIELSPRGREGRLPVRLLTQTEANPARGETKAVPRRKFPSFFTSLKGVVRRRNKAIGVLPMYLVVSEFLTWTPRIFVEFERIPRKSGFCILNDFQRLPLVLALFSPN